MEYWIRIGFTTAMIVVISGGGRPTTVTPNTRSTETMNKAKNTDNSHSTTTKENFSCPKVVNNGTLCPDNRKCPEDDNCDKPLQCPCMDGYKLSKIQENSDQTECVDIRECFDQVHACGANSGCSNTDGGYFCICNKGFRRGNITAAEFCPTNNRTENSCSDIDECKEHLDNCGPNSTCNNTIGSFHCICISGFENVSNNCIDINECKENHKICDPYGDCENTDGSYNCACMEGYKSKQCTVKCKEENETQTACNGTEGKCILKRFTDSWTPSCNDDKNSLGDLSLDQLLDALDDLISKFLGGEKEERLRMAGIVLNALESMIQNLAYMFPDKMPLSNKNNYISAKLVTKSSQDGKIFLNNTKSSIYLDEKTALGNGFTSVIGSLEYGNIAKLLEGAELWKDSQNHSVKLVSPVVSVFLGIANTTNLDQPIQLRLNFSDKVTSNETHCAFWSVQNDNWSTKDCVTLERNQDGIVCNCTHLTSFAVLMALKDIQSWTLDLLTRIGLSISIVCLALAILTFCCCRILRGTRNTIHIHLCVSLLLGHVIFLIGIEAYANTVVCGIVAGLLHFFYLSAFCWMSLEGLELYLMLVEVFKTQVKTRYLLLMGYGVPIVIITISAAVVPQGYGTETHCWLSFKDNFIWSFMGPVCVIILVNCGIFVLTVWKLAEKMTTINPEQGKLKRLRTLTITSVAQLCILGCCWAFGFLMFGQATLFFAYAFTICNILQGVQIFFLHCLMNKKIREIYGNLICAIVHFRSPVYSEFTNSSNVNTQSRAKLNKESGL